jgi:hypothetical protein
MKQGMTPEAFAELVDFVSWAYNHGDNQRLQGSGIGYSANQDFPDALKGEKEKYEVSVSQAVK